MEQEDLIIENKEKNFHIKIINADYRILETINSKITDFMAKLKIKIDSSLISDEQWKQIEELIQQCILQLVLAQYHNLLSPNLFEVNIPEQVTLYFPSSIEKGNDIFFIEFPKSPSTEVHIPYNKFKLEICINNTLLLPNFLLNVLIKEKRLAIDSVKILLDEIKNQKNIKASSPEKEKLINDINKVLPSLKKNTLTALSNALGLKEQL